MEEVKAGYPWQNIPAVLRGYIETLRALHSNLSNLHFEYSRQFVAAVREGGYSDKLAAAYYLHLINELIGSSVVDISNAIDRLDETVNVMDRFHLYMEVDKCLAAAKSDE